MIMQRKTSVSGHVVGAIFGLLIFIVALASIYKNSSLVNRSIKAEGEVVGSKIVSSGKGHETISTISFIDKDGNTVQFQDHAVSHIPSIGDRLNVFYDPQNPQSALIDDGIYMWVGGIMMTLIGAMLLIGSWWGIKPKAVGNLSI